MAAQRAVQSAKDQRLLKVRTSGIRVSHVEAPQVGTVYDLKGPNLVKVSWDTKEDEDAQWGEYRVGADANGEEHYDVCLAAVHSYLKVDGAAASEEGDEEAKALNGIYVMGTSSFIPEYHQLSGPGRITFEAEDEKWIIWNTFYGRGAPFYMIYEAKVEVPEKGWEPPGMWEEEYSPAPTLSKHELKEGQDVKLRTQHADSHIPESKYPGPACAFNNGDICTIERIDGLFFAPKISPDQWIPLRAAVPATESQGEDEDEGERLKKAEAAPKPKAKDGNVEMLKMLKTLVRKVDTLEKEIKKLQK